MRKLLFLLSLIITLFTTSCEYKIAKVLFPERPDAEFIEDLKRATPDFQLGWKDGCEVGMSAGSNTFYKIFYRNNAVDGYKMVGSPDYKTAWGNAFWYCYRADYVKQKSAIWSSTFSGYR
jgi:hypothetical protein